MEDKNEDFLDNFHSPCEIEYKKCSKCGNTYPQNSKFFYKRSTSGDGFDFWCKKCKKEYDKIHNELKRLSKYNITAENLEKIRNEQNNKCAICGIDFDYLSKIKKDLVPRTGKPRIDHDHRTCKVRGLLCSDCNIILGCFKDNPFIIIKAIKYLREHQK